MSIVPGQDVPEVPQEWVDAVNKAVNDANHEDLCMCDAWPDACKYYKPGQWDLGVDLTIAVGALAPLIRAQVGVELAAARSLRLAQPSQAVDPAVHTPGRVRCYLKARGWHLIAERETYDLWQLGHEQMANAVCVPTKPRASDYRKRLGIALGDLAQQYETGELAVLADIEAAGDA